MAMMIRALSSSFVFLLIADCHAFSASSASYRSKTKSHLLPQRATASSVIEYLENSQAGTINRILSTIPTLQSRPDLSWPDGFMIGGYPAKLSGFEAPGAGGNVSWMAALCVASKVSSLTIFNGPLTNVPHLLSRCCVIDDNTMAFTLDFRPRAYGAYEKRDAQGNYPGPEELGRAAFEYSGNRMEFDTKFGTTEVVNFMKSVQESFQGAISNNRPLSDLDLLTRGPLVIDVIMPLTETNVASVASAREQAANFWLSWAMSRGHDHRPGAPINSQYVYDTKFKQNAYGALLQIYSQVFGEGDGLVVASTESGPLDEAYVGGGS